MRTMRKLKNLMDVRLGTIMTMVIMLIYQFFTIDQIDQWEETGTSSSLNVIVNQSQVITFPRTLKLNSFKPNQISVLAIVVSSPSNFDNRLAIRQTWMQQAMTFNATLGPLRKLLAVTSFQVIFQIGLHPTDRFVNQRVRREADSFGDVLLQDFREHYNNLSVKSVLLLNFVQHFLPFTPSFIFKIDDDVYLNVPEFFRIFPRKYHLDKITGYIDINVRPIRWAWTFNEEERKWIVPKWMFKNDTFPAYAGGPSYIIPGKHVKCMLDMIMEVPRLHLEDVYITGLLRSACDIGYVHENSFVHPDPCKDDNVTTIHHSDYLDQYLYHQVYHTNIPRLDLIC